MPAPAPRTPSSPLQIERLLLLLSPGEGALPEAVRRYSPPAAVAKKTSYDALKAAGHRAAGEEPLREHVGAEEGGPISVMALGCLKLSRHVCTHACAPA